ncbi:folate-binding protein [Sphingobium sp. H39-3-25]|uniref:CAF17-like 4Fe-4S cluster assembly/insertion protein YgfZ n=1 Tax=Sphingobium arseniciresistens TaxID=3030834 RepID=UPI0023B95E4A|nr:folate-binding protein [Sphingobium arseniciresistens]
MTATTLMDRAVIRLSGEEARAFLQGLVTQDVLGLVPGVPRWSALLSPQGKVLFDFLLWADGEDVLIDCEATQADALARRLTLYRLRRKVVIAVDPALLVHWALQSPDAPHDPRLPALGHRWLSNVSDGDASAAWRSHRLSLGVLEGAEELGRDQTLWLEANAGELGGVDFTKGCYVGQENTARMHYRSKVNRRLVAVPLDQANEKRQRVALPELGLSVELRRVEDLVPADLPDWLAAAIAQGAE